MRLNNSYFVLGLGNCDLSYRDSRYNVGFKVVDKFQPKWTENKKLMTCFMGDVCFLRSTLGMNKSGAGLNKYVEDCKNLIVVYDDMDFEPGIVRIKNGGGHGRHNGVKSVIQNVGRDFIRVRVGIGKSYKKNTLDFVLGNFKASEKLVVKRSIVNASDVIRHITQYGSQSAMNKYNA